MTAHAGHGVAEECGIERDQDGARICTLHKVALIQQSIQPIEPNPYGHADSVTGAWYCPKSGKTLIETSL